MEMLQIFLWIVYPFTVTAIVAMGLVWQCESSKDDEENGPERFLRYLVKALMILSTATGLGIVMSNSISHEPLILVKWLISLAQLKPDMELILNISILSKIHFVIVFLFLLVLAFTKEIAYLLKPHKYVKKIVLKLQLEKRS